MLRLEQLNDAKMMLKISNLKDKEEVLNYVRERFGERK